MAYTDERAGASSTASPGATAQAGDWHEVPDERAKQDNGPDEAAAYPVGRPRQT